MVSTILSTHISTNKKYNPIRKTIKEYCKKRNIKIIDKRKDKSIDLLTDIFNKFSLGKPIERIVQIPKQIYNNAPNQFIINHQV